MTRKLAKHDVSLADLSHDIAGALPSELILRWNESDKSGATQARFLAPYLVHGTIVSMDAAGLSLLSQQRTLPEVMKLVSEPKEVLHAFGKVIGGQPIGVWAADNAQMFFPDPIDPVRVVRQMLGVQERGKALSVKIGIGVHFAQCVSIADGLFGEEADFIEGIAEDDTRGGEIVVSQSVYDRLPEALRASAVLREDLADRGALWSITDYRGSLDVVVGDDIRYPTPFDEAFFRKLHESSLEDLAKDSFDEYRRSTAVVFVKINRQAKPLLLDSFTELSLADLVLRRLVLDYQAELIKSTGALAIVLFPGEGEALEFARAIVRTNRDLDFDAHVGICKGEVLLFPLASGERDIAGNAVNVASKLAEDAGIAGILVESSAVTSDIAERGEPFEFRISGVAITGRIIQP